MGCQHYRWWLNPYFTTPDGRETLILQVNYPREMCVSWGTAPTGPSLAKFMWSSNSSSERKDLPFSQINISVSAAQSKYPRNRVQKLVSAPEKM